MSKQEEFFDDVINNNIKNSKKLLKHKDVKVYANNDWAMNYACKHGQTEMVKMFFKFYPAQYFSTKGLLNATTFGHFDIVKAFFRNCTPVQYLEEPSLLTKASQKGFLDIVNFLLKKHYLSPLEYNGEAIIKAAQNGHLSILKALLKYLDKFGLQSQSRNVLICALNKGFCYAAQNGHIGVIKFLQKQQNINPDAHIEHKNAHYCQSLDDISALRNAISNGHLNIVKLLLKDKRVDPSSYINSLGILNASLYEHTKVVELLMKDKRIDPSVHKNKAIDYAFFKNRTDIIKLLWNDTRVKTTLENDNLALYNEVAKIEIMQKKVCGF